MDLRDNGRPWVDVNEIGRLWVDEGGDGWKLEATGGRGLMW